MSKHRKFSADEKQFLCENHERYSSISGLVNAFNERYNANCSYSQINHVLYRCGIRRKPNTEAAHSAVSKEIGATRNGRRGEVLIKTENGWKRDYVVLWEKVHGSIPNNHVVIHLDNNIKNNCIDNLALIPRKYLIILCQYGWLNENPEITKAGIKWCELHFSLKNSVTG